jgi:uncharacterized protein (TIGR02145 family)
VAYKHAQNAILCGFWAYHYIEFFCFSNYNSFHIFKKGAVMFKSIFKAVVVSSVAAVFSIGCGGDDGGDDNGGGGGDDSYTYSGGTVKIGGKTWMAKNLDRATANSKCYDNDSANCAKYGRLYTWAEAKSACPAGWHLPSDAEWTALTDAVGGSSTAGKKLKATSNNENGTDEYGFSALLGGFGHSDGSFYYAGYGGNWWSATENDASEAWYRWMNDEDEGVNRDSGDKAFLLSVRCVQD